MGHLAPHERLRRVQVGGPVLRPAGRRRVPVTDTIGGYPVHRHRRLLRPTVALLEHRVVGACHQPGACRDQPEPVDAGLNRHLPRPFHQVNLAGNRVQAGSRRLVHEHLKFRWCGIRVDGPDEFLLCVGESDLGDGGLQTHRETGGVVGFQFAVDLVARFIDAAHRGSFVSRGNGRCPANRRASTAEGSASPC